MKILRWLFPIISMLVVQFLISTIIYNIQHWLNIFSIPIIFGRYFLAIFIAVNIGAIIAPGNIQIKSKIFILFYGTFIIAIGFNLLLTKAEPVRIASAIIECLGMIIGAITAMIFIKAKNYENI